MEEWYIFITLAIMLSIGAYWFNKWYHRNDHDIEVAIRNRGKKVNLKVNDLAEIIEIIRKSRDI